MCIEIGLRWMRASLRGYGGETPTGGAFLDSLDLEPEVTSLATQSASAWQSASVELFAVDMAELQGYAEPYEEFASRVERGFLRAAEWLDARPPGPSIAGVRRVGRPTSSSAAGCRTSNSISCCRCRSSRRAAGRACRFTSAQTTDAA